jgi:membrane-associated protease RseP (regulator of RpoE activity)
MRKLGIWGGPWLAAMLLVAGVGGSAAGTAMAQDRAVPWLGVMTQSIDSGLRDGLDYEGEGVLVSQVVSNSPASRAGIRKGDILVSVNSRDFDSPTELTRVIRDMRVGQNVSIVLVREGRRRTVSVRLGERPGSVDRDMDMDELRDLPDKMDHDGPMKEWSGPEGTRTFVFPGAGRGRLGVRVENLKGDLGTYFDVPGDKGALIVEVLDGTPADKAGLKSGDVIVEVGNRDVEDSDDLVKALQDRPAGNVSITVMRKGARRSFQVELEESMRGRFGRDMTLIHPRMERDRGEARREIRRDDSGDEQELQQLREEVRELRKKLREMENGNGKDDNDDDDDDSGNDDDGR